MLNEKTVDKNTEIILPKKHKEVVKETSKESLKVEEKKVVEKMENVEVKAGNKMDSKVKKKKVKPLKPKAKNTTKKSAEVLKRAKLIAKNISLPTFRGRFGNREIRRVKKKKWQKWRYPRGIDIKLRRDDGAMPSTGYQTNNLIKFLHPSGFEEVLVFNSNQLNAVNKELQAIRIASAVGRKKRIEIVKKAKELDVRVLNR